MSRIASMLVICVATMGCGSDPPERHSPEISTDDIAHAQGLHWWFVDVPSVPDGKVLCMAFVDQHGVVESRAIRGVRPGDKVKVVLSDLSSRNMRFSLVAGDRADRATIINHFRLIDGPTNHQPLGSRLAPGSYLMKKSSTNSVNATADPLAPHELAIVVDFFEEAQPWERNGYRPPKGLNAESVKENNRIEPAVAPESSIPLD